MVVLIITHSHALDDAAGLGQEGFVRDLQQEVPAIGFGFWINFQNFHRIFPHAGAVQGAADGGGAGLDAPVVRRGQGGAGEGAFQLAEDPLGGVFGQVSQEAGGVRLPPELPRVPRQTPAYGAKAHPVGAAGAQGQKPPSLGADPVAQGGEGAGVRVIEGDGADAGDALAQIHPQPPFRQGDRHPLPPSAPENCHLRLPSGPLQSGPHRLRGGHRGAVDFFNPVPDFQARPAGGAFFIIGRHGQAVVPQPQTDGLAPGNQTGFRPRPYGAQY